MSRELLNAINTTSQSVAAGSSIPLLEIKRRVGYAANLAGTQITLNKPGYYMIVVNVNTTSAAGTATLSVQQDGVTIPGATSALTAEASTTYSMAITTIARVKCYCQTPSMISITNTGSVALTTSNVSVSIVYLG